jgi:serine/threonine-protein phosphatase 2B catalytic subunit
MKKEPNLMRLDDPVVVVGDIHGQYYDLCHIFDKAGNDFNKINYLFLGDYVDRGIFGI